MAAKGVERRRITAICVGWVDWDVDPGKIRMWIGTKDFHAHKELPTLDYSHRRKTRVVKKRRNRETNPCNNRPVLGCAAHRESPNINRRNVANVPDQKFDVPMCWETGHHYPMTVSNPTTKVACELVGGTWVMPLVMLGPILV